MLWLRGAKSKRTKLAGSRTGAVVMYTGIGVAARGICVFELNCWRVTKMDELSIWVSTVPELEKGWPQLCVRFANTLPQQFLLVVRRFACRQTIIRIQAVGTVNGMTTRLRNPRFVLRRSVKIIGTGRGYLAGCFHVSTTPVVLEDRNSKMCW